jgi:hypothetical protein
MTPLANPLTLNNDHISAARRRLDRLEPSPLFVRMKLNKSGEGAAFLMPVFTVSSNFISMAPEDRKPHQGCKNKAASRLYGDRSEIRPQNHCQSS